MGEVEVHALRGVDLGLFPEEFLVVFGPSGSGKSSLLNILGGLDVPTSGEVRYLDHNLTAASAASDAALTHFRRQHVGFVFQFYNLIPSLTALETVHPPLLSPPRAKTLHFRLPVRAFRCRELLSAIYVPVNRAFASLDRAGRKSLHHCLTPVS
jgi:ABC-type lipoprotein export system ATPase subunit